MSFNTPILLLTFTRLDTTKKVFERIKEQKPKFLYIASDGPRHGRADDAEKIDIVRQFVLNAVDWDCELKTLFRDENLGCGVAPYTAITWFFENVEQGIILEDDCLPYPDFFGFCESALNYHVNNEKVWTISGTNLQGGKQWGNGSYYFSNYSGVWGWATWARAWKHYDYEMKNFDEFLNQNIINDIFRDQKQRNYWIKTLTKASKLGSWWDYQWLEKIWSNNGLAIIPNVNLIKNIGFTGEGTHTLDKPVWYDELTKGTGSLKKIVHNDHIVAEADADDFFFNNCFKENKVKNFYRRVLSGVKRRLPFKK